MGRCASDVWVASVCVVLGVLLVVCGGYLGFYAVLEG